MKKIHLVTWKLAQLARLATQLRASPTYFEPWGKLYNIMYNCPHWIYKLISVFGTQSETSRNFRYWRVRQNLTIYRNCFKHSNSDKPKTDKPTQRPFATNALFIKDYSSNHREKEKCQYMFKKQNKFRHWTERDTQCKSMNALSLYDNSFYYLWKKHISCASDIIFCHGGKGKLAHVPINYNT